MKRFTLTGKRFTVVVEVVYDTAGSLYRVDFSGAVATDEQKLYFKNIIPVKGERLYEEFKNYSVTVTEVEFEVSFADWKREYPRSRNMHMAEKYWPKITSGNQYLAFLGAIEYRKYCVRTAKPKEYIMLPERFLKEEQWKNDWKNEGL